VKISPRSTVRHILARMGVPEDQIPGAFELLDRRDKLPEPEFAAAAAKLGLDQARVQRFNETSRRKFPAGDPEHLKRAIGLEEDAQVVLAPLGDAEGAQLGVERAMAGGGRYDQLIELFGGPKTPAVGFGMGDVVLSNVLADKGLMPAEVAPRPEYFIIAATDAAAAHVVKLAAKLRRDGWHARFSYKPTRNIGKLLKDASAARAWFAVIVDDRISEGIVEVKNMETGEQKQVPVDEVAVRALDG
jgi:histidyl-tRNA synthetase